MVFQACTNKMNLHEEVDLEDSEEVGRIFPIFHDATKLIADPQVQTTGGDISQLLRLAADRGIHFRTCGKGRMHHFEIVGQIGRQQFLDQSRRTAADGAARLGPHHKAILARGGQVAWCHSLHRGGRK